MYSFLRKLCVSQLLDSCIRHALNSRKTVHLLYITSNERKAYLEHTSCTKTSQELWKQLKIKRVQISGAVEFPAFLEKPKEIPNHFSSVQNNEPVDVELLHYYSTNISDSVRFLVHLSYIISGISSITALRIVSISLV